MQILRTILRDGAVALLVLILAGFPTPASAQSISVPHVTEPPRLADFIDLDDLPPVTRQMAVITGLVQRTPVDGAAISEPTMVYVGYDTHHLYAVFVCLASPDDIRAHRVNRDRIPGDNDSVALHLDTFRDQRRLYGFQVNPAGVQVDGTYTEEAGWDLSFDTAWTAETAIRANGYVVVMTIPFASLRFPKAEQHRWGLFVYRGMPRKNEEAFWPAYSTRYQGRIAYAAEMSGLRGIQSGHRVRLMPYTTFTGEGRERGTATPVAVDRLAELRAGVDLKTSLRESLVLDLTANPDFSQVESDEPQATVNRRFETFFPERRPFFIENASYFETPIQVLFTRRIREPTAGVRFSGKAGRYAVGALVADDRADTATGSTVTSVVRVSRDLADDSRIGAIYAGVDSAEQRNHVAGIDGRWRFSPNVAATGQVVSSQTDGVDRSSASGVAYRTSLDAGGQRYASSFTFSGASDTFQAGTGFVPRTDVRELAHSTSVFFRPAGRIVTAWGPTLTLGRLDDHRGRGLDSSVRWGVGADLARQTRLAVFRSKTDERLRPVDVASLPVPTLFEQHRSGVEFHSAPRAGLVFGGEYSTGTAVNLTPPIGELPVVATSRAGTLTVGVRPTRAFTIDTTYVWTELGRGRGPQWIFSDHLVRSRWSYQASRRLSARAIFRYELLTTNPDQSSLRGRRYANADLLLTYLVQPGTALYIGVSSDQGPLSVAPRERRVFVKASYLIQR